MKLSVVIPAHNEAEVLGPTLEALTRQLAGAGVDYEVLVVDDGSPLPVEPIVERVATRLASAVTLRQANAGSAVARNTGIRASRGRYLVFLDADDHLLPLDQLADALRGGKPVREYAFEVKMFAVARVNATSRDHALELVHGFQSVEVNHRENGVTVTEISADDGEPILIEIDGNDPA